MQYQRKTKQIYVVEGNPWGLGWSAFGDDPIYEEDQLKEAQEYLLRLQEEYPNDQFQIERKRVPIEAMKGVKT